MVTTVWMALVFTLAGCAYPGQSAYWGRAVPGAVSSTLVDQRIQQYRNEYELEPRPQGTPQEIAEAYMRRYQPGPLPRIFESSYVYDRHGQLIAEIIDEGRRIWMPIDQISPYLIQALVSTEDGSFFDNSGVDHRRIVGAMLQNLGNPEQLSGASTITMQLARNLFMQPEERFAISIERKIDEVLLAQDLTRLFTKQEILEMYLNLAYFGHLAYGPEAAARTYFGKSALELTWAEATLLAGLLQQPANLDPFLHLENAKARQRIVLDMLVRRSYLTKVEAGRIYNEPILLGEDPNLRANLAPHFLVFLADYLERQPEAYQLSRDGLVVYTTLDLAMQQLGEEIIRTQVEKLRPIYNLTNAALVAIKPGTGEILTMVGSVDFGNESIGGQVNVTLRERQPGSALKPI
ncbi:MAG: transglycosylase domain-containing protein, partial [Caldilineaceae bacterium]|nr:transglycosylase domain-containing protein [Caldilineaceae bacterium]